MIVQRGVEHDWVVMCSEAELERISNALDRCLDLDLDDQRVHPLDAELLHTINNGMAG